MGENDESTNSDKVLIVPLNEDSKKITQILSNEKAMKMLEILADKPMSASDVAETLELPLTTVKYNLDGLIEVDLIKVKETKWSRKGREVKIYEPVQKFIVVAPGSMKGDRTSIISMLKKYLGLVAGAVFAATGLEAIIRSLGGGAGPLIAQDTATAPLYNEGPMAAMSKDMPQETSIPDTFAGNGNVSMDSVPTGVARPEMLTASAPNGSEAGDVLREGFNATVTKQTQPALMSHTAANNISAVAEPVNGIIQNNIFSHASVWFLFGGLFVITLLFVREMYYRKKNI
ncbi:helix-turn-helix domain-containing protein [Methanolobus sp.]|uniref:ArsR/SmtB family transcription factor n=1 Tax=Methanolobus sp. TaxID=1874737 RepID=UPI0025EA3B22|nr:helix-turn-helix domain-containing protein [Methanolobus sp.]